MQNPPLSESAQAPTVSPATLRRRADPAAPPLLSIVVPFFNEQDGITHLHQALDAVMARLPDCRFEVLCVDDGSHDHTLAGLLALSRQDPRFEVIELSRNFGKEAALTAGIDAARGDAVIPIDADLQDPPELILDMVAAWRSGADVVPARRSDRSTDSPLKRLTAAWFYRINNLLSTIEIPDGVGDFRLMDRIVVDALGQLREQQRFMKGLFAWLGFRTVVLDYRRQPRAAGSSKFSGWKLWNFALEGITSFSSAPLKLWVYVGAVCALLTFAYALYIITRTLIRGVDVPGYASLLVAVLFFGSLQLISVGVLGEYIGRIYMESKRRPLYLVRQRYKRDADA